MKFKIITLLELCYKEMQVLPLPDYQNLYGRRGDYLYIQQLKSTLNRHRRANVFKKIYGNFHDLKPKEYDGALLPLDIEEGFIIH